MKTSFLLIGVILISAIPFSTPKNLETVLSQINEHPYGQALGSLVQMHMSTGDDQTQQAEIRDLLVSLKEQLTDAGSVADTKCGQIRGGCEVAIPTSQSDLRDLQGINKDNKDELLVLQQEIEQKSKAIADKKKEKVDTAKEIQDINQALADGNTEHEKRKQAFSNSIQACKAALSLLQKMVDHFVSGAKTEFVQVADSFINIKNLFDQEIKLDKSTAAFIQPIQDVLLELSSENSLNIEKITEVKSLIQLLHDTLLLGLNDAENEFVRKGDSQEKQIDNLSDQLNNLSTEIDLFADRLQEMNDRVQQLKTLIEAGDSLSDAKEREISNLSIECETQNNICVETDTKRRSELKIIEELLDYFNKQVK